MWSRIENRFNSLRIPIAIKLTILYSSILFCILITSGFLAVGGTYYLLQKQAEAGIDSSIASVVAYLDENNSLDNSLLQQNLIGNGTSLRVYGSDQELLLDSEPYTAGIREFSHHPGEVREKYGHDNVYNDSEELAGERSPRDGFEYSRDQHGPGQALVKTVAWTGEATYYLEFAHNMDQAYSFLHKLAFSLILASLIALIVAIWSGHFMSRRILRPIRDITAAATEIEINSRDRRIGIKGGDDELRELAVTFNHMLDRVQNGVEQQRRFISDASHELRTPVTVISGYADMLDRWGKQDSAALGEGIEAIKSETANMHSLIEKLLFLARTDGMSQQVHKAHVNMELLIEEVVKDTFVIAPEHQVTLGSNSPAVIAADEAQLKQMLRIFIENSIKYTPAGGSIAISSHIEGSHLIIEIKDSGIGIAVDELPRVFDRFYRVDQSRTRETGGSGLGLAIARSIARQQAMAVEIDSSPEGGTTARVFIPLQG